MLQPIDKKILRLLRTNVVLHFPTKDFQAVLLQLIPKKTNFGAETEGISLVFHQEK
jgi:hypothetical protein